MEDQLQATVPADADMIAIQDRGGKYLTFFLDEEEYGVGILKVQEIIGMMPVTRVPGMPLLMRGVINLRGKIIPVVDLRIKFGLPAIEQTEETCIVVMRTRGFEMGVIVDRVSEVRTIATEDIKETPAFGTEEDMACILGIGNAGDRVNILLDIDEVLSTDEVIVLQNGISDDTPPT